MSFGVELGLLAWGTLVGLDLVSVLQTMIARPLVAGTVAGLIVGDPLAGLAMGLLFELFQYDILPVGAVRYPEYGPATIAAVAAGQLMGGAPGIGIGAFIGLVTAMVGGSSLHILRRVNARAIHDADGGLETGDVRLLIRLHAAGIARDALRAALVTAFGLGLAWVARHVIARGLTLHEAMALAAAACAAALAASASGVLRTVAAGPAFRWFALGVGGGALVVWLR
jgi:PTS system mannose-specific IIC component